jgi:chromosome partitioning protein
MSFQIQRIMNIYGTTISRSTFIQAEKTGAIPSPSRKDRGSIKARTWGLGDLPVIGERFGFLRSFARPQALAVFSPKGGVLKTTLSLNIARLAALHNIRTCVVGLDIQGDITKAMNLTPDVDEDADLSTAMSQAPSFLSLIDIFAGRANLEDVVVSVPEIPTLAIIPETAGLAALDVQLMSTPRREYWLLEKVIQPLKERFELIVLDCSPSWSQVITNALVACDAHVCPLETKINHYRNYREFTRFLEEFERTMKLNHTKIFVPTRFNSTRKLSVEIRNWYLQNVPGCTAGTVREGVTGEEAMAMSLSMPEYAPTTVAANEMRDLLREIWSRLPLRERKALPGVDAVAAESQPRV